MARITPAGAFGFYAGLCLLGWLFCFFCFPETAGLSLEEVTMVFKDDFGIKASERLRREKRAVMEKIALGRGSGAGMRPESGGEIGSERGSQEGKEDQDAKSRENV